MAGNSSEETILEQLRHGLAKFELVSSPVPSVSSYSPVPNRTMSHRNYKNNLFFARIGVFEFDESLNLLERIGHGPINLGDGGSPAMKKVERYSVKKVTGDGRCLFRALVKGMAIHKGLSLNSREETENADELRTAVKEVICGKDNERTDYTEALMAITVEESLKRYCQRIGRSDFWGGESELLVLSKLCHQQIIVYIPEHEHAKGGYGSGFIPIAEYGADYSKASWTGKAKKAVRLLYSGKNHYDLLV